MTRWRSRLRTSRKRGPDSIVKNTASSFVVQMTTAALTAVLTVFLVRALGVKQYGLFALSISVSAVALAFADLGISNSTARFVAEHRGRDAELRELIADALKLKVVISGLACALLAALASIMAGAYGNPALVWPLRAIALATFGQSTFLMLLGVSTALGRVILNVRLVVAESLLEVSASVALVLAGTGAAGAAFGRAFGYVLGAVIAASVVLRFSGHAPVGFWRLPRRATVHRVGRYAGPVFAIDASFTLSSSLSVLLLGAYGGLGASGIFQAPAKLITLVQYVGVATASGVAPRLTRGPGQEPNVRALNGALRGLIGFQCLLLAPAVLWAGPITHVLLGPGYSRSADVLAALSPYIFFSGLAPLVTTGVNYLGEAGRRIPISLATLAIVTAGSFILIPSHGVVGAAIATDIAYGFYTLAHIWLCRRLFKLRLGMLVWSLACGLTAAGAMGIVLESVGTKRLTPVEWLEGAIGGLIAYVAMLIFTREIRGAHIARAGTKIGATLAPLRLALGSRRAAEPAMLPEPAAATDVADYAGDDAAQTNRTVESPNVTTVGAAPSIDRVESSPEVSIAGPDEPPQPPVRDQLVAEADPTRSASGGIPRRKRRHPAITQPVASSRLGFVATLLSPRHRPPAARPPGWVEGRVLKPAEESVSQRSPAADPPRWLGQDLEPAPSAGPGDGAPTDRVDFPDLRGHDPARAAPRADAGKRGARSAAGPKNGERRLPPASQPPAGPSHSADQASEDASAVGKDSWRHSQASDVSPDPENTSVSQTDIVYQITWRLDEDAGVFELRPVVPSDTNGGPTIDQSSLVSWGWRVAPPPTPEARRAHLALVDRLLAAGWRRAGSGDAWFAHRFRSPDRPSPD